MAPAPSERTQTASPRGPSIEARFLIWFACGAIVLVGCIGGVRQLAKQAPIHRWEAAMLTESFRVSQGQPVYEEPSTGHATHMYGPLATALPGAIMAVVGPTFLVARLLSLVACAAAAVLVVWMCRPAGAGLCAVVALALLWGSGRMLTDFAEARPDGLSLLFMVAGLGSAARAWKRQSFAWHALSLGCLTIAILFKQTAVMACAVPALAAATGPWHDLRWKRFVIVVLPLVLPLVIGGAWFLWWPRIFHFAVEVPSQYRIDPVLLVKEVAWLALAMPLLWVAVVLRAASRDAAGSDTSRWLLAAVLVAGVMGALAASKQGGVGNSLVPALFAQVALFLWFSEPLARALASPDAKSGARVALAVAALMAVTMLRFHVNDMDGARVVFGDAHYGAAVDVARALPGTVVSPQDPSIAVFARGRAGRSLMLEYDASGWPDRLPDRSFADLEAADAVITVGDGIPLFAWPLPPGAFEAVLRERGFSPSASPALDGSVYHVWTRPPR